MSEKIPEIEVITEDSVETTQKEEKCVDSVTNDNGGDVENAIESQ